MMPNTNSINERLRECVFTPFVQSKHVTHFLLHITGMGAPPTINTVKDKHEMCQEGRTVTQNYPTTEKFTL